MTKSDFSRHLATSRQAAAVATAFTLPLTTSGEAITVSIFAILALVTLDRARLVATLRSPAALIPILLFALMLIGVAWSTQPLFEAVKAAGNYAKLLLIPLLIATTFTPRQALQIAYGFLAACAILLVLSWASLLWPSGPWGWIKSPGVAVKDNAVQSSCFALCALGLALGAIRIWQQGRTGQAVAILVVAVLFFADIFMIAVSKTGLLMAGALLALLLFHAGGWKRAVLIAVPAVMLMGVALWTSAPAQQRLAEFWTDMRGNTAGQESVSTGARLDFWTKGIEFVRDAPVFGHGTGSIRSLYQALEATRPSPYGAATPDPHNQFLAIAIQIGLIGAALLLAMWVAHLVLFLGRDLACILGQAVVLQNVIGSLFNSHLSAVSLGMVYCLAVGLLGAVVIDLPGRTKRLQVPPLDPIAA
jgi:O-antigen ligase